MYVVVVLLFSVHGQQLWSWQDGMADVPLGQTMTDQTGKKKKKGCNLF